MGFFDDNPFGGMFDWDGDGKESFFEQMVGLGSMDAMMNDDDDESYTAPFGLDLRDDTDLGADDLDWNEDDLDLESDDTDLDYGETPQAAEPPQETGEYVWTEINPYAVLEQTKKAEMQALADKLATVAAQKEAAEQPPSPAVQPEAAARAEERLKQLRKQNDDALRLLFWAIAIVALIVVAIAINDLVEDHQKRVSYLNSLHSHSYRSSYTTRKNTYTTRKNTYTTRKNTYTTRKPYYEQNDPDPYDAKDYGDPDDFYYWHEDDFYDYEDAEEYYYDHND